MKAGDVITETYRIEGQTRGVQRKVYIVLGPSRVEGKIRICTWSHQAKDWSLPHAEHEHEFSPAPEDWPQTKAVKKWLETRGESAQRYAARLNEGGR